MNKEKNNSNKCLLCGRPTHKKSKYCIFHASAEEKTEEEFKQALKEYVDKIKEKDGDYNFKKFVFIGDINFKKDSSITTFKNANFTEAIFEGNADFQCATFKLDADFGKATFKGVNYFMDVTFERDVDFVWATFEQLTNFAHATFEGNTKFLAATFKTFTHFKDTTFKLNADFWYAIFKLNAYFTDVTFGGEADFEYATFEKDADFGKAKFEGNAKFGAVVFEISTYFKETTFKLNADFQCATFKLDADFTDATFGGKADFEYATFEGDANFGLKYLVKILNFLRIKTLPGKKIFIRINNEGGKISFDRAYLENTNLDIELVKNTLIDFTGALLRKTNMQREQIENHILQEEKGEYLPAKKIYLLLKNNFHSIGQYEDESWAYKKEKDMERKSNCHFKSLHKWLWSCFLNGIFGYGIQPSKVIMSAILIITLFAFLFMNPGISNIVGIEEITSNNFFDCLYFSTITFTTLGYGDFRPLEGIGRILAGSEAFIGAFMMALFVYTFARRTGGR